MAETIFICSNCQKEFPEVDAAVKKAMAERPDIQFSHGICPRHFSEFAKQLGRSDEWIENKLKTTPSKVPDLENNPELVKQYSRGIFTPEDYKKDEFPVALREFFKKRANIIS